MVPDQVHARHLAELEFLKNRLDEAGLPSTVIPKSDDIPIHTLLSAIEKDDKDRDRFIHFSFVPISADELEYIMLLQLYTTVHCDLKPSARDRVEKLLLAINCRLAIGHFSIKDNDEIYYRYVYSSSSGGTLRSDEILEVVSLFLYMLDMFAKLIEEVGSGETSLSFALSKLD